MEAVLLSVISMLNSPNIDSPANIDASIDYRNQRDKYNSKVRKLAAESVDTLWNNFMLQF